MFPSHLSQLFADMKALQAGAEANVIDAGEASFTGWGEVGGGAGEESLEE